MSAAQAADHMAEILQVGTAADLAQVPELLELIAGQLPELLANAAAEVG